MSKFEREETDEIKIAVAGSVSKPILAPAGFLIGVAASGLKKKGNDLAVIYSERPAVAAAVFTRNIVRAAPVLVSREHLRQKTHRLIVVNAGCANACTGEGGLEDARSMARIAAEQFECSERDALVASTGVIGVRLDMNKIENGIKAATRDMSRGNWTRAAEAIITTDTVAKFASKTVQVAGKKITITGIAKGSGMIHPNMATMLSFVITDAAIGKSALQSSLRYAVKRSFNRVSVDGDTSTNDTLAVFANGAAENDAITATTEESFEIFTKALTDVCSELAIKVARDGEGADKLITIRVCNAPTERDAERIAETISTSPLVKTAIAGSDANWGRILAAAGRSGAKFDYSLVDVKIGNLYVAKKGAGLNFDEQKALEILKRNEVAITVDLNQGEFEVTQWTCDMTERYIHINAAYRT